MLKFWVYGVVTNLNRFAAFQLKEHVTYTIEHTLISIQKNWSQFKRKVDDGEFFGWVNVGSIVKMDKVE